MDPVFSIFIVSILFAIIIALVIERWAFAESQQKKEQMYLDEISKANKALVAKSANEYVMMTAMDKTVKEEKKEEPLGLDISELSDEEYDKMIKLQNS